MGGFGSAVLESLSEQGIIVPTKVVGLPDWYIEQGPQDFLREKYGLTAEGIYQAAKDLYAQTVIGQGRRVTATSDRPRPAARVSAPAIRPHGDEQGS